MRSDNENVVNPTLPALDTGTDAMGDDARRGLPPR